MTKLFVSETAQEFQGNDGLQMQAWVSALQKLH